MSSSQVTMYSGSCHVTISKRATTNWSLLPPSALTHITPSGRRHAQRGAIESMSPLLRVEPKVLGTTVRRGWAEAPLAVPMMMSPCRNPHNGGGTGRSSEPEPEPELSSSSLEPFQRARALSSKGNQAVSQFIVMARTHTHTRTKERDEMGRR